MITLIKNVFKTNIIPEVESIRKTKLNLFNFVTLSKQQMQIQPIIKVPVSYLYTKTFFSPKYVHACTLLVYTKNGYLNICYFQIRIYACNCMLCNSIHTHILSPSLFFLISNTLMNICITSP